MSDTNSLSIDEAIEEIRALKAQLSSSDLEAFSELRKHRTENKQLKDEITRLMEESVSQTFASKGLEKAKDKLESQLAELNAELTALQAKVTDLEPKAARLPELEAELEQHRSNELNLSQELEALKASSAAEVEQLKITHSQEFEAVKGELDAAKDQIENEMAQQLSAKEEEIEKLQQTVEQFKAEFLSQESAVVAEEPPSESAFALLRSRMEGLLGFPGRTLVEQVFRLCGADENTTDPEQLEEAFEALQDTAGKLVRNEEQEAELASLLKSTWQELGLGGESSAGGEPASPEPVAEAPSAEPAEPTPVEEPAAQEPAAEEPVAEESAPEEPVAEEPVAEEPVAEEAQSEPPVAEAPSSEEPEVTEVEAAEEPTPPAEPSDEQSAESEEPAAEEPTEATVASEESAEVAVDSTEFVTEAASESAEAEVEAAAPQPDPVVAEEEPSIVEESQEEPVSESSEEAAEPVEQPEPVAEEAPAPESEAIEPAEPGEVAQEEVVPAEASSPADVVTEEDMPPVPDLATEAPAEEPEVSPEAVPEEVAEEASPEEPEVATEPEASGDVMPAAEAAPDTTQPEPVAEEPAPEVQATPEEAAPSAAEPAELDFDQAAAALQDGEFEKALPVFAALAQQEPDEPTYLVGQIAALAGLERYTDAYRLGKDIDPRKLGESEDVFRDSFEAVLVGMVNNAETDIQRKRLLVELIDVTDDKERVMAYLDEAENITLRVPEDGLLNLLQARNRVGQDDVTDYLMDALHTVSDRPEVFSVLQQNLQRYPELNPLAEFMARLLDSSRAESLEAENGIKDLLSQDESVEELLDEVDPGEEAVVQVFLEHLIPRSQVHVDVPSEEFEEWLHDSEPAAFVGSLRQALRSVDYTVFFDEIDVLSYDGDDHFLLRASPEPKPTLMFGSDVDDVPPEELRFLVLRELFSMARRHSHLAHISRELDDSKRWTFTQTCIDIHKDADFKIPETALNKMTELQGQAEQGNTSPEFRSQLEALLAEVYQAIESDSFLELGDFLYEGQLNRKWLDPIADGFGARQCGLVVASYAIARDQLDEETYETLEETGFGWLYQDENLAKYPELRLRLQRLWTLPFKALISEADE